MRHKIFEFASDCDGKSDRIFVLRHSKRQTHPKADDPTEKLAFPALTIIYDLGDEGAVLESCEIEGPRCRVRIKERLEEFNKHIDARYDEWDPDYAYSRLKNARWVSGYDVPEGKAKNYSYIEL
jgi:hypothetical protein